LEIRREVMDDHYITINFDKYESLYRDKLILDSIEEEFENPQIDVNKIGAILSIRKKGDKK
jgi:hypothetical protein